MPKNKTRKKPTYYYPEFVSQVSLQTGHQKRYWLCLEIDKQLPEGILVILKNPSRANKMISDKTVYNVSNYIFKNKERFTAFADIGKIIILNLIPNYLTDSSKLIELNGRLINKKNRKILRDFCSQYQKVIIAWGNHPKGLYDVYEQLKAATIDILLQQKNDVFYVDKLSANGNPKHGQVWGYQDELKKITL